MPDIWISSGMALFLAFGILASVCVILAAAGRWAYSMLGGGK